jgi:hypothetical protein
MRARSTGAASRSTGTPRNAWPAVPIGVRRAATITGTSLGTSFGTLVWAGPLAVEGSTTWSA